MKKSNNASIPIMITMDMRKKLKILGYTLEEIKYLTPAESNDIIKKSIIKISPFVEIVTNFFFKT